VLPAVLADLDNWTAPIRASGAAQLRSLLAYVEDHATAQLPAVLEALRRAALDDEAEVASRVVDCARLLGHFVDADATLGVALPWARGEGGLATARQRTGALALLAAVFRGLGPRATLPQLRATAETLCDPALCASDDEALQQWLLRLVEALCDCAEGGGPDEGDRSEGDRSEGDRSSIVPGSPCQFALVRSVLQIGASGVDVSDALDALASLGGGGAGEGQAASGQAASGQAASGQAASGQVASGPTRDAAALRARLFALHFPLLLQEAADGHERWENGSPGRLLFDALLRRAGPVAGLHAPQVLTVFVAALEPSRPADLRLSLLALLETLLGNAAVHAALRPHAPAIAEHILLPNAVWRVGRVESTIRKLSVACLATLLGDTGLEDERAAAAVLAGMRPVLTSCLADDDATTRRLSCIAMHHLLGRCGGLGSEAVNDLYPELLKRLDDSCDEIRRVACLMLVSFLGAAPKEALHSTCVDYMCDTLFVHLDDPAPPIQAAVFEVLRAAAVHRPEVVGKKAARCRRMHRSPDLCDRLAALCAEGGG
jgi:dynein assembly factor 5